MQNITVFSIFDYFYENNKENRTTGYHKLLYFYVHNNGINFTCGPHKSEGEQFSPSIHSYHSIESLTFTKIVDKWRGLPWELYNFSYIYS